MLPQLVLAKGWQTPRTFMLPVGNVSVGVGTEAGVDSRVLRPAFSHHLILLSDPGCPTSIMVPVNSTSRLDDYHALQQQCRG